MNTQHRNPFNLVPCPIDQRASQRGGRRQRGVLAVALVFCLGLVCTAWAQTQSAPAISLFAYQGDREVTHFQNDPLLLFVTVQNPQAAVVHDRNETHLAMLERWRRSEAYSAVSVAEQQAIEQQLAATEIPAVTLGTDTTPIVTYFDFLVSDAQHDKIDITVTSLAENDDAARTAILEDDSALLYVFAITPTALADLAQGEYTLVAALDATPVAAQGGGTQAWHGVVYSKPLRMELNPAQQPATTAQLQLRGLYYLNDHQYDAAEAAAREWLQLEPHSVAAWEQLGRALYGQGQHQEALTALNTAVDHMREKYDAQPPELPESIQDLIREIEEAQR